MSRLAPIAVIIFLGLLFFTPLVLQPDAVLYSDYSDFINYHLPCKYFLVRSWQQMGELPLWCPEMFSGMPFVHDVQVAAFYPPHAPLYLVPENHLGAACSWLIVAHVLTAGLCMYGYARYKGLKGAGAVVAALGYMFAGKWLMHILVGGHFNAAPLAWLPLVLLFLEQAIERASFVRATLAGVFFAFIVLGAHPQLTVYSGMLVALWTLASALAFQAPPIAETPEREGEAPAEPFSRRTNGSAGASPSHPETVIARWLLCGLWTALVAGLLSAIQLLPSLEATRLSSRTLGVPLFWDEIKSDVQLTFVGLVGPPVITESGWFWERRGGLALLWLAAAACAPLLVPRRQVRVEAALTGLWIFLGLGGVLLLHWVPGFHLWRLPSRMLIVAALPIALLAGRTTQELFGGSAVAAEARSRCQNLLVKLPFFVLIPLGLYTFLLYQQGHTLQFSPYWPSLLLTFPLAWWLISKTANSEDASGKGVSPSSLWITSAWVAVLLTDLWALGLPLVAVHSEADLFAPSASVRYLAQHAGERGRVLDISRVNLEKLEDHDPACATPLWPNFAMVARVEQVRGYNPLDYLRYKEYLQFLMNRDAPLRAVENLTLPGPVVFEIENQSLLELLGVRYVLLPRDMPLTWFIRDPRAPASWSKVFDDPTPRAYSFVPTSATSHDAGLRPLPPYVVYENRGVLPRAFLVHDAGPLREDKTLETLKRTDFRRTVLLEDLPKPVHSDPPLEFDVDSMATIRNYQPNRLTIDTIASRSGWLVLTDPWYPGWTCTVDGRPTPIQRANFLFRAVEIPGGAHRVEFRFLPQSFALGRQISVAVVVLVMCILLGGLMFHWLRRKPIADVPPAISE